MTKGFTLIELLLVVVIIGIVAAFVLPKFGDVKEKAYVAAMKNDLRNAATHQEIYYDDWGVYAPLKAPTSEGVNIEIAGALLPTTTENILIAEHNQSDTHCAVNLTQDFTSSGSLIMQPSAEGTGDFGELAPGELKCDN